MSIRTYQSFSGYIATEPSTEPTRDGTPRFYARAGQRQANREANGSFTKLPTQYMPIVAFGDAAEEAALLAKGDKFTAEGRIRAVSYEKDGTQIEGEEFEIFKIGRRPKNAEHTEVGAASRHPQSREIPAEFTAPNTSPGAVAARAL